MAQNITNLILLDGYGRDKILKNKQRRLDAQASYTELAKCLKILEMNSVPELRNLKAMMRRTMKDMMEIGNGKKNS